MQRDDAPILEFDPSPTAVIEPTEHIDLTDIPPHAVLCFFQDVIAKAVDEFDGREIDQVRSEIGLVPVYELGFEGSRLALMASHVTGKTWTTDALYRETREKAARRVAEGCLTVEMEAAAFFAVARFRGVTFGQLLYAGDDLSGDVWNARGWDDHETGRQQLFRLAAEAVLSL